MVVVDVTFILGGIGKNNSFLESLTMLDQFLCGGVCCICGCMIVL